MSNLLSLPIEIQIIIVRKLPLRDCIAYAQVSTTCHDLVYYVFSHRLELDFSSLVSNCHLIISSEQFLDILHAHTRATIIRNFCLPHQFNDYAQLARYFNLYWAHTFIPTYDDSSESFPGAEPSMLSGTHVGHIRGELTYVHYLGFYGASTHAESFEISQILCQYDDDRYGLQVTNDSPPHVINESDNWGTVVLDTPYTTCSKCQLPMEYSSDPEVSQPPLLCWQCRYFEGYFASFM